jgi:hypothetical protein
VATVLATGADDAGGVVDAVDAAGAAGVAGASVLTVLDTTGVTWRAGAAAAGALAPVELAELVAELAGGLEAPEVADEPADDAAEPTDEVGDDAAEPTDDVADDAVEPTDDVTEPTVEVTGDVAELTVDEGTESVDVRVALREDWAAVDAWAGRENSSRIAKMPAAASAACIAVRAMRRAVGCMSSSHSTRNPAGLLGYPPAAEQTWCTWKCCSATTVQSD